MGYDGAGLAINCWIDYWSWAMNPKGFVKLICLLLCVFKVPYDKKKIKYTQKNV